MTKLSEKIVNKIKTERIMPIPKWQLLLKTQFVWAMAIVGVLFGAVSVAISLHLWMVPLNAVPTQSFRSTVWQNLAGIPYFWLILIVFFIYVAYHNFQHTEDGYKWRTFQVVGMTIAVSIILGVGLLVSGFAPWFNGVLVRTVPGYTRFGDMRGVVWMNPQEGRLAGQIVSVDTKSKIVNLRDLDGNTWSINYDEMTFSAVELKAGVFCKVLGTRTDGATFTAKEFRPWEGMGKMMQGNGRMMRINR